MENGDIEYSGSMFTEEEGMVQKETGGGGVHVHSTEEEDDSYPRYSGIGL